MFNRSRLHLVVVGVAACSAFFGTSVVVAAAPAADPLVGKAGSVELTLKDFEKVIAALPDSTRAAVVADPKALSQAARAELLRRLVMAEVKAKNFEADPSVVAEIDRLRGEIALRLWLARNAQPAADYPSTAEVEAAYARLVERAEKTADVHLEQLFVALPDGASKDTLQAALRQTAELQDKVSAASFAALFKKYAAAPEGGIKASDLGTVSDARLLPEVRSVVATLKAGDVAGPIKTAQGVHFIHLIERKPSTLRPLADVKESIVAALRQEKAAALSEQYLAELSKKSPPTINEVELSTLVVRPRN